MTVFSIASTPHRPTQPLGMPRFGQTTRTGGGKAQATGKASPTTPAALAAPRRKILGWTLTAGALAVLGGAGFDPSAKAESLAVDTALVLAPDVSSSVNDSRYRQQIEGMAAALKSPRVAEAMMSGPHQKIAVATMEWGLQQQLILNWRVLSSPADLHRYADDLLQSIRQPLGSGTGIGDAINAAIDLLFQNPYPALRQVIDVSGDGQEFGGEILARTARDRAGALGITINGLPIKTAHEPNVDQWYQQHVIIGPDSFIQVANSPEDFAQAFERKLIQELFISDAALKRLNANG